LLIYAAASTSPVHASLRQAACRYKLCRKAKACSGDARACLNRGIDQVPYDLQNRARDRKVYCAVKTARRFSLRGLC